jgi:hypothetical protein
VTWGQGDGTSNEASISFGVFCGSDLRLGLKLVDIVAAPPPSTTYYELEGCVDSDYAWTTINPSGGTGQRYVLPGVEPKFYRYTGSSNSYTSAPSGYNGSIQIASGQMNCP